MFPFALSLHCTRALAPVAPVAFVTPQFTAFAASVAVVVTFVTFMDFPAALVGSMTFPAFMMRFPAFMMRFPAALMGSLAFSTRLALGLQWPL